MSASSQPIEVRPLRSMAECQAAAELQREVWGSDYTDVVPATFLHVVDYVGGLAAGAFDTAGQLLGFVFGVSGVRDGELVHWSHMLGVRSEARNLGLGRRLKEYQRDAMRALGIRRILWTFDPLMAKNAYFNVSRLGASVIAYVPDMYGTTSSPLHLGMPTDRLIACLDTTSPPSAAVPMPLELPPMLTAFPRMHDVTVVRHAPPPERALIEIPADIVDLLAKSPTGARTWRLAVRDYFQWALSNQYAVVGVHRDAASNRSFYLLRREQSAVLAASMARKLQPAT
ncbi:MAG TPA: GNAT family N-acetyltransferase [Gemmatimonadaceae bacterium]|nr:GNAT family N-acetyltransferase [Gemmatimonadaceae bacterium]